MSAAPKPIVSIRRQHRPRFWVGVVLVVIGVCGMAVPFISFGLSRDEGVVLESMAPVASGSVPATKPKRITDRLIIAEQEIDMPLVAWKSQAAALETGAWLWPDGSRPGQTGNAVIFGHRFRYLPPLSNTLFKADKVAAGDHITVRWQGTDYTYTVLNSRVIDPTDLSVLSATSDERITIITCTPVFSTAQRLVITAVRAH